MSTEDSDVAAVRTQHAGTGVSTLGRLLWVGAVSGLVIGGLAAAAVFAAHELTAVVDGFSIGAMVGVVAGVAVQALNAGALHIARKVRPRLGRTGMRLVLMPLPAASALALPWLLLTPSPGWFVPATEWVVVLTAGALSAVTAWALAPWCLASIDIAAVATTDGDEAAERPSGRTAGRTVTMPRRARPG